MSTDVESRIKEQIAKAAQVGFAAHTASRQIGAPVPWSKLTDEHKALLLEAAGLVRSALVLEPHRPEDKAMRACNRRYLAVSHAFIGAALGHYRDCGIDVFIP